MDTKRKILNIIKKRILILDGATGTELQKRGYPGGICPEKWTIDHPDVLSSIYSDYCKAGSDIVFTSTFGANRLKLSEYNISDVVGTNKKLARLAKNSVTKKTFVAGDIGPTGHFIEPFGNIKFEEAVNIFKEQVKGLLEGGVDLFVIETMMDIQEARAALIAVKELTDSFTMVTMTFEKDGRTLNGTNPAAALITLQSLGADAFGCNCSTGPLGMLPFIESMKPLATIPLIAKPNAGLPKLLKGKTVFEMSPKDFAQSTKNIASAGANILGGCCGTTPKHIAHLEKILKNKKPQMPLKKSISALSSSKKSFILTENDPLKIIGERINPTGKKALQEELLNGKTSLIRSFAREQKEKGASLLDVNVGVPDIDEVKVLKDTINMLSIITDLPLVLDSSNIKALEKALRIYPGRALINSISGEKEKIEKLLPIAAKYGAMFILLPLTDKEIPATAIKRTKIIQSIYGHAKKLGFTKQDIVVDCLVMTVSSDPRSAIETLDTISWCRKTFKTKTVIGLSNVSFGMPQRKWINASFLSLAASRGLNMAIANPSLETFMNIKMASDVLLNKDPDASKYIQHFTDSKPLDKKEALVSTPEKNVSAAILEGNREEITEFISKALSTITPEELVNTYMIPSITKVGDLFEKKEYFLPQLIASAETMKKGFNYLQPLLKKSQKTNKSSSVILLATVRGDIHDIGKNIVALMLKNHGFKVIDLGKDVSTETILNKIRDNKPSIVGLSALMTTTMVNMKEVITQARKKGFKCHFIVGGAVVTNSYAKSIGAQYAKDGVEVVKAAKILIKNT